MLKESFKNSLQQIKNNFENGKYDLMNTPCVLSIDWTGVYLHNYNFDQNTIKNIEDSNWDRNRILVSKLKGLGYGDYRFFINLINKEYFESRERLNSIISREWKVCETSKNHLSLKQVDQISLEEILQSFEIDLFCNFDYYQSNIDEIEKDLGQKVLSSDLKNTKLLKEKLYKKLIVKIFGGDANLEKSIIFKNFCLLFYDGCETYATAERGDFYFIFYHEIS